MTELTCEGCRFFRLDKRSGVVGGCHRRPPVIVLLGGVLVSLFPDLDPSNWGCGEWEAAVVEGGPAGELRGAGEGGVRIVGGGGDILSLRVEGGDVKGAETVRDYLRLILRELWLSGNAFSTKRPLGKSDWWNPVYRAMIVAGIAEGRITDDGGVVGIDIWAADKRIAQAIMGM